MRKLFCLLSIIPMICFGQIEVDRDRLYQLLNEGETQKVLQEAKRLRKEVYGKCAVIDYFIAKSLCLDGHFDKSKECFEYILQHYPLLDKSRRFISSEIRSCSRQEEVVRPVALTDVLNIPLPNAGVGGPVGKMGMVKNCMDTTQVPSYSNLIDEEHLQKRIFDIDSGDMAQAKIRQLVGSTYDVQRFDRFILVFRKSQQVSNATGMSVARSLKRAYDFFVRNYRLRMPDKYITVYLMPDYHSLSDVARKVHGITLSRQTLGYSLLADLSLLGIATANPDDLGTLYHELWHLVVRTDVGDISPWLDEGIAGLYSTAGWRFDDLYGEATWRTRDLRRESFRRADLTIPTIAEMLNLNWEKFNGGENKNICQASINYSLANHLMLYLQEKELLAKVVTAFKKRQSPAGEDNDGIQTDVAIMEKVLGKNISDIQEDFHQWFQAKYYFKLY